MIKLTGLSKEEVCEISKQIADAFYDYKYNDEDQGIIKYIKSRDDMFVYMNAITQAVYNSGLLYTTSENREGFLMLSGVGVFAV
ncbi:MAG: hypothetical protein J6I66_07670 [Lachnospiraceae bacterium]|nr:hypothetical protein [Lachnospiraceae bacterium]